MDNSSNKLRDIGILFLRISVGLIFIIVHGIGKITAGPEMWTQLGGSMSIFGITFLPTFWGFMAAFTEFFVPMFLIIGLFYRPAALLLAFNMIVAAGFHFSRLDPWAKIEYPFLLVILFISMFLIGPGRYSVDEYIKSRKLKKNEV
ncbi:MAG: DoxX family protein [Bacteroidota bacterium]|nr:DoxX family protein [Bacteroidota bacterium]